MKKTGVLLLSTLLAGGVVAQETYEESVYAFRTVDRAQPQGLLEQCKQAIADSSFTGVNMDSEHSAAFLRNLHRPKLYRDGTRKEVGHGGRKFGKLLFCLDWGSFVYGEIEYRNYIPSFFVLTLGDKTFYAVGGAEAPAPIGGGRLAGGGQMMNPLEGGVVPPYPAPETYITSFSALILPSLPSEVTEFFGTPLNNPGYGGVLTMEYVFTGDSPDPAFDQDGMGIIRLYSPEEE